MRQSRRLGSAILEPDELPGIVYALGVFERAGQVTPDEARAWRRATGERWGIFVTHGARA